MEPYVGRFKDLLGRVLGLVRLYTNLQSGQTTTWAQESKSRETPIPLSPSDAIDDVLRAAVVLLHAAIEDFLRGIAQRLVPWLGPAFLDKVPLLGDARRSEKFSLGKLATFRGQSIDDVIRASVDNYLSTSTFNNVSDIVNFLKSMEIEIKDSDHCFKNIDQLMKRRHQIVHRADKPEGSDTIAAIHSEDVYKWTKAAAALLGIVVKPTVKHEFVKKLNAGHN
jgi:hypothetical protein